MSIRRHHVIAALLVVAAVMFVIGVTAEGAEEDHSDEPVAESVEHRETGEAAEREEAESADEEEGRVLGVDVESPLLVTTAVVVSLLLAALTWRRPTRVVLIVVGVVTAVFAVFDLAEVAHQLDEDNSGLVALALAIALLHATTAGLAVLQARTADPELAPVTT
jgi:di/tricarboxylate transporter